MRTYSKTPINDRFWRHVNKDGSIPSHQPELGACWEWTASTNGCGYGQFLDGKKNKSSHRLSWQLINGPIPAGQWVLHRCDNRLCVNPAHLFLGTSDDNVADREAKGRGVTPDTVGEANSNSKFTIVQIRTFKHQGIIPPGMTDNYARQILAGDRWRHVT